MEPIADWDKLAFEQASAEIERQRSRIAEIRANAGIVIAATSLVASFLGSKTIDLRHGVDCVSAVALAFLPMGLLLTCRALWPVRDLTAKGCFAHWFGKGPAFLLRLSGTALIWRHRLSPEDWATIDLASAAERLKEYADENQKLLDRRANMLMAAILVLVLQACLWAVALITL